MIYKEYYSIGEIDFSKPQVRWLLYHLPELREGRWPEKPDGYAPIYREGNNHEKKKTPMRIRQEPTQNRVLEIAAEVEIRLDLVINYISGWPRPTRRIKRRRFRR